MEVTKNTKLEKQDDDDDKNKPMTPSEEPPSYGSPHTPPSEEPHSYGSPHTPPSEDSRHTPPSEEPHSYGSPHTPPSEDSRHTPSEEPPSDDDESQEEEVENKVEFVDSEESNIFHNIQSTIRIMLNINEVGANISKVIYEHVSNKIEGKCINHGYIKPESVKILQYSSGSIFNKYIKFDVIYEASVCYPTDGSIIQCIVKNVTKAGIRAEIPGYNHSPIIIFIARDHHYNNQLFNDIIEDNLIKVKVIGQRFELYDTEISVIADLINIVDNNEKKTQKKKGGSLKNKSKPKLVIRD